jgi:hypothetical protein
MWSKWETWKGRSVPVPVDERMKVNSGFFLLRQRVFLFVWLKGSVHTCV